MQVASLSPSFNAYSNSDLAGIAARVASEFRSERRENSAQQRGVVSDDRHTESDGDEDFDFAFVTRDLESSSPISAGEIFQNGKIRPSYPAFDRGLLPEDVKFRNEDEKGSDSRDPDTDPPRTRNPLRKLFIEERETTTTTSSSSSEADELDGAAAAAAAEEEEEVSRWKKSSSASAGGDSKRWRLKNLLRRSRSAGSKNGVVLLTHTNSARKKEDETKVKEAPGGGVKIKSPPPYNLGGGEKRRSYLPYRQDLVGFFSNINGLRKNLKRY